LLVADAELEEAAVFFTKSMVLVASTVAEDATVSAAMVCLFRVALAATTRALPVR
jgi:hypothetical protein